MRQAARSMRVLTVAAFAAAFLFASGAGAAGSAPSAGPLDNTHPRQVCATPRPAPGRGPVAQCDAWALAKSSGRYLHLPSKLVRHPGTLAALQHVSAAPAAVLPVTPFDLATSYGLAGESVETVAIVDAYDDPNVKSDLDTYDTFWWPSAPTFPTCATPSSASCFEVVNQTGQVLHQLGSPAPPLFDANWSLEISLDVEAVHTVCFDCKIILVEANDAGIDHLAAATNEAAALGANVISNSYGVSEGTDSFHLQQADFNEFAPSYRHPGVIVVASSGDDAYAGGTQFPADVNDVVSVGGTTLSHNPSTGAWGGETVWNDPSTASGAGSGCSAFETAQPWQTSAAGWGAAGCGSNRGVADVSADADPNSGLYVWNTVKDPTCNPDPTNQTNPCWWVVGGTSLAAPIIAATYALAANPGTVANPDSLPYAHFRSLHDVTSGVNGSCSKTICRAATGYDGPTGMGTPNGLLGFSIGEPMITSFSPMAGPAGTTITINGSSFTQTSSVTIGGTPVQSFTVNSDIKITAVAANGTTGQIAVTTPGGTMTTGGQYFAFAPLIESFAPNGGGDGTTVVIHGTGFGGATDVKFGGTRAASYHVDSSTQITAVTGSGTNTGPVSILSPGGTGTSSALFYGPPSISSLGSSTAAVHSTVTINGSNLTGATHVTLGPANCPFTVVSLTKLTVTIPSGATTGTFVVTTPGGTTAPSGTLTVSPPPSISSLSVSTGPVGTPVQIFGSHLTGTVGVRIGSIVTVPTSVSDGEVDFTIPPGAVTGPISILNPAGSATSPGSFTVTP